MSAMGEMGPPIAVDKFQSNHLPGLKPSRGLFESLSELPAAVGGGLGYGGDNGDGSRKAMARDFNSRRGLGKAVSV